MVTNSTGETNPNKSVPKSSEKRSGCDTLDGKLHGNVEVAQVPLAALHLLVPGSRGLAGHLALFVDVQASLLVAEGASGDRQGRKALVAPAAVSRGTRVALTHALMLLHRQPLHLVFCKATHSNDQWEGDTW